MDIFLRLPVVGEPPYSLSQFFVVRGDGTSIAQCTEVLAWIETESSGIGEVSSALGSREGTMRLAGVFQHFESMFEGEYIDGSHVAGASIEVDGQNDSCMFVDECFGFLAVDECIVFSRFTEYGFESGSGDGEYGGDESVGWNDDFGVVVPGMHVFPGSEDECQRVESVAHTHAVFGAHKGGELTFEGSDVLAVDIPTGVKHPLDGPVNLTTIAIVDLLKVQKFHFHHILICLSAATT